MAMHVDPSTGQMIQIPDGPPPGMPGGMLGGLPPELAGGLPPGLGAGLPPGLPPGLAGGLPPELAGLAPPGQKQFATAAEALSDLFDYAKNHPYMQMETDDTLRSQAMKWLSSMQDALAKKQKAAESAHGIGPSQKFMAEQRGAEYVPGRPF